MRIRKAKEEDYPAIARIIEDLFPKTEMLTGGRHTYFVAESEGRIAGFCHLVGMKKGIALAGIGVLETEQGKGIGASLIDAAISCSDKKAGGKLLLKVRALNPAVRLYLKKGFCVRKAGETHVLERKKPN